MLRPEVSECKNYSISVRGTFLHFSVGEDLPKQRAASCPPKIEHFLPSVDDGVSSKAIEDSASTTVSESEQKVSQTSESDKTWESDKTGESERPEKENTCIGDRRRVRKKRKCQGACNGAEAEGCYSCQRKINELLISAAAQDRDILLEVVSRNVARMNGVNLATAFHRLARAEPLEARDLCHSRTFEAMLEAALGRAARELQRKDGVLPANCCTIIAWSCARLGAFDQQLFGALARVAAPELSRCQSFEITNMLWAFTQLHKTQPAMAAQLEPELVSLLDGAKKVFAQRGPKELKSQVLLSALVTVATLPNLCRHSETWLFATAGWELLKRWAKLSQENKVQVGVAIHHSRSKGGHFFHTVAEPMISRCPELAQLHHGLARR